MKKTLLLSLIFSFGASSYAQNLESDFAPALERKDARTENIEFNYTDSKTPLRFGIESTVNTRSVAAVPKADYLHPAGFLFSGRSLNNKQLNQNVMLGYPSKPATWRNVSVNGVSYLWTMPNDDGSAGTYQSAEIDVAATYPDLSNRAYYNYPILKTTSTTNESTSFQYTSGGFLIGGNVKDNTGVLIGLTNCDVSKGVLIHQHTISGVDNGYVYGTRHDGTCDAVLSIFEASPTPYVVDSIWINLGNFSAPTGHEFNLVIHRIKDIPGTHVITRIDTIATAVCKTEQVVSLSGTGGFMMPFKSFMLKNKTSGQYEKVQSLQLSDLMMVELTGFNKPGVELSVAAQTMNTTTLNSAYFFRIDNGKRYESRIEGYNAAVLVNLGAYYPAKSGIGEVGVDEKDFSVVNKGADFELRYADGCTSVSVYNIAGQLIAEQQLSADGVSSILHNTWSKGVYVFKFSGKVSHSLKAIK